jgi:hemoglobin/transferrin/lactoferrin receptor protein
MIIVFQHKFNYGAEYVMNDVESTGSAVDIRNGNEIAVSDRYPASQWNSSAVYLSYQNQLNEKLLLQAGTRFAAFGIYSDFTRMLTFYPLGVENSEIRKSAVKGSLGLVFRPDERLKLSLNTSTGFRAPNVDDMGKIFDFGAAEVVVPNTALGAEYAYNAEFSVSKIMSEMLKIDFNAFYTYLDNAMVRREYQVNGNDSILYNCEMSKVYAIQNAAYGAVFGFNAGVDLKLPSGFSILSRYNYQLGTEEMDNETVSRSRHAAPAYGATRFTYQRENIHLQLYALYSAAVSYENLNEEERQKPVIYAIDTNGNPYSPAWYTLNFKAKYQFSSQLAVSAGVENITDQRYRPYSSGLVAAGRNFIVSLRAGL